MPFNIIIFIKILTTTLITAFAFAFILSYVNLRIAKLDTNPANIHKGTAMPSRSR